MENARKLGALGERFLQKKQSSLEAQLVNIADAIAYSTHDIDDGLRVGYLNEEDLARNVPLYNHYYQEVRKEYPDIDNRRVQKEIVRRIIGYMVDDLVSVSQKRIELAAPKSVEDVRNQPKPLVSFSEEAQTQMRTLKAYLMENLYRHYRVQRVMCKSSDLIKSLFEAFTGNPILLPPAHKSKIERFGLERTVADYIAGMTDRYAAIEYSRVIDPTYGL